MHKCQGWKVLSSKLKILYWITLGLVLFGIKNHSIQYLPLMWHSLWFVVGGAFILSVWILFSRFWCSAFISQYNQERQITLIGNMFLINYVNNRNLRKICPQTKKFTSFSLRKGENFTNIFQFNFFLSLWYNKLPKTEIASIPLTNLTN